MEKYTISALVEGIGKRDPEVLEYIYDEYFFQVARYIYHHSGNEQDARDVFQEALVALFRKQREGGLEITSSFKNYLIGICKIQWFMELKRREKFKTRSMEEISAESVHGPADLFNEETARFQLYQNHFNRLGEICRKILKMFYNKVPMEEIARVMGYRSVKFAKQKKYLCKEKLMEMIRNDPRFDEG